MRVVTDREGSWQAYAGAEPAGSLRRLVMPDGRCRVQFRECRAEAYAPLLAAAPGLQRRDLYAAAEDGDEVGRERLTSLGFRTWRREHRYRIDPATVRLPEVPPPPGLAVISAAEVDLDRLRELDDDLRNEIPGSDGWRWAAADFREETFSTGFDPATYLVAVARRTGDQVGLVRVWLRPEGARLGCLGVRPAYRGSRVTAALLGQVHPGRRRSRAAAVAALDQVGGGRGGRVAASRSLRGPGRLRGKIPAMNVIDKIAWIRLRDGQVLSSRSRGKQVYYLPGGKREPGESDLDTLVREIREELSVTILPDTALLVGTFQAQAHGHPTGTTVRMTCYTAGYRGVLRPAAEIAEVVWLSYADRPRVSPVDQVIFDHLHAAAELR